MTPIVPVVNNKGIVIIFSDYSVKLNPYLKIDRHPIPRIEESLSKNGNCGVQSKLDMSQAYVQAQLSDKSKEYMTITTHRVLYQPERLFLGVASGPVWFQREKEKLLDGIEGISIFFNDVRVIGKNKKEYDDRLRADLTRFREAGITLRIEKCI